MKNAIGLVLAAATLFAQPVRITVDGAQTVGPWKPIHRFFGYDEPNYTYAPNGRKLVGELAKVSDQPVYLRTHFMLATGDGTPDFKWGSTNAYTEDAAGKPVYDWTIVDRIVDTYRQAGAKPFLEIGFMPEALSRKPQPYRPVWSPGAAFDKYYVGWSYPPKDFAKWGELVYQWARHSVEKYGLAEVESWYWEVWNEPDIAYWHGTPEEYDQLYDAAVRGVRRAAPHARVGGPATTGPASAKAGAYLRQFLEYCEKNGTPLDFISYHAKGRPSVVDGHVRMGIEKNIDDVTAGFAIVSSFEKFRGLPIVLSESDPEGCAACSARVYPQNAYRNTPLYASYTASMFKRIFEAADRDKVNIEGMLTWAFEFEGQPYFDGFRTLATNGVDKPILNVFRMAGRLGGNRVKTDNAGSANVDALATKTSNEIAAMVWNYDRDDVPGPDTEVRLAVSGIPDAARQVTVEHWRIDGQHSNAYTVWKRLGSPQKPTAEQASEMMSAGQLQQLEAPRQVGSRGGKTEVDFALPKQGVSLVVVKWGSPRR
jgi:xylan 1,4-beta-xylosidase